MSFPFSNFTDDYCFLGTQLLELELHLAVPVYFCWPENYTVV